MFLLHQKETSYPLSSHSLFPFPPVPRTTNLLSVSMEFSILDISYHRNHSIYDLWCLFPLCVMFSVSSMLEHVTVLYSFSWLNKILLCGEPHFLYPYPEYTFHGIFCLHHVPLGTSLSCDLGHLHIAVS